ncbi:hypothetical protein ACSFA0_23360 [Variovorax sp. LT1P1]|uniref:hypothetical protein n=1 Tax=Variovorax sp. LT1P1 TaxID=3443730 RepID=UPI003F466F65
MESLARRLPRAHFTRVLHRMCKRLDECSVCELTVDPIYRPPYQASFKVSRLSVYGSYARGASDCGDLDVLVSLIDGQGDARNGQLVRALFGGLQLVHCEFVSDGDEPPHATDLLPVWTGPGCDWKGSLEAITPDPQAGRFERDTDVIPLRLDQLNISPDEAKTLAVAYADGRYEWEFVPFGPAMLTALLPGPELWPCSKRIKPLIAPRQRLMCALEPQGKLEKDSTYGVCPEFGLHGSTLCSLGRPFLLTNALDENVAIRQLALIPYLSAQGPNGAWLIRRGPKHPDTIALRGCSGYYLRVGFEVQVVAHYSQANGIARTVRIFTSEAEAKAAEQPKEGSTVARFEGLELLSLLSSCDVLIIDNKFYAVRPGGRRFAKSVEVASVRSLAEALSPEVAASASSGRRRPRHAKAGAAPGASRRLSPPAP